MATSRRHPGAGVNFDFGWPNRERELRNRAGWRKKTGVKIPALMAGIFTMSGEARLRAVQGAEHGADGGQFDVGVHARAPQSFAGGEFDLDVGDGHRGFA